MNIVKAGKRFVKNAARRALQRLDAVARRKVPVPCNGTLDSVTLEDGRITWKGWCLSRELGRQTGATVSIFCGPELEITSSSIRDSSPDVARALPDMPEAANCRYTIEAAAPRDLDPERAIVRFQPVFESGSGNPVIRPLALSLNVPPEDLIEGVGGGFINVAFDYLRYFVEIAGLQPHEHVLDIGCGCGRIAYALGLYLDPATSLLEGFDIVDSQVKWASETVTPRYPHFRFHRFDIHNEYYNPGGKIVPGEFTFPYEDGSFDFVFLTSVFTHMLAGEVRQYIGEMSRVLRPGGRCFSTCFLLNGESLKLQDSGSARVRFRHVREDCVIADPENPEGAVAYDQDLLQKWFADNMLLPQAFLPGHWCGRSVFDEYQDILITKKA